MQEHYYKLADYLSARLNEDEIFLSEFAGEDSEFVRFNKSAIRQPGSVSQAMMSVDLIRNGRHTEAGVTLTGTVETDQDRVDELLESLRVRLRAVPEDPHLLFATALHSTEQTGENRLPDRDDAVDAILRASEGRDLVGIYAQGGIYRGFANSFGQRNWFSTHTFHFDWCFYLTKDKAVKSSYAGFEWDQQAFDDKVQKATQQLETLKKEPRTIEPGEYRVYLSPAAMMEIFETLAWGGFGMKAHRTKTTSLLKMAENGSRLNPAVTVKENTKEGMAPNFQRQGFIKPGDVVLFDKGKLHSCLVSPRSAREYGVEPNGASEGEYPESLDMAAGDVPKEEVLERLDTGVLINQLWYLNYSDRPACRMTGMTRFATFWVENGEIAAPLNVMRFDETIYRMLGENLIGLTREREFIPSAATYGGRSTESYRLPGALVNNFRFTL